MHCSVLECAKVLCSQLRYSALQCVTMDFGELHCVACAVNCIAVLASAHLLSRPNNTDGNTAQTNGDTESMMMMMMDVMVKIVMEVSIGAYFFGEIILFAHFQFHPGLDKLRVQFAFKNLNSKISFHV